MWAASQPLHTLAQYNRFFGRLADKKFKEEEHWVFRGLSDSSYPLITTLERVHAVWQRDGLIDETRRELEDRLLREFKRRCHHYDDVRIPDDEDHLEWLAMMRHWGAPTRLMDWTYSYHIATFFALQNADERCKKKMKENPRNEGSGQFRVKMHAKLQVIIFQSIRNAKFLWFSGGVFDTHVGSSYF
jgi:hypothetical protein